MNKGYQKLRDRSSFPHKPNQAQRPPSKSCVSSHRAGAVPTSEGSDVPICIYCNWPIDEEYRNWIGHRTMAHDGCAWAWEDAYWWAYDAEARE